MRKDKKPLVQAPPSIFVTGKQYTQQNRRYEKIEKTILKIGDIPSEEIKKQVESLKHELLKNSRSRR